MCRPYKLDTNNTRDKACNSAGLKIVPLLASSTFIAPYFHYVIQTRTCIHSILTFYLAKQRKICIKSVYYIYKILYRFFSISPDKTSRYCDVSIPKRRIFLPLFLLYVYDGSVLQNFRIFTHLLPIFLYKNPRLTEVTYHCINFNDRQS